MSEEVKLNVFKFEKHKCNKCGYEGTGFMYIALEGEDLGAYCLKCIAALFEREFGKMVKVDE